MLYIDSVSVVIVGCNWAKRPTALLLLTASLMVFAGCAGGLSGGTPASGAGAIAGCPSSAGMAVAPLSADQPRKAEDLIVVDCMLPGQMVRLGMNTTWVTPPRPTRTTAWHCAVGGGQYVIYDPANLNSAVNVWERCASEGDKIAQTYLGEIYEKSANYPRAAAWYRKAAAQGYARAQNNLGFLYEKGLGAPKDSRMALQWYRKAAGLPGELALASGTSAEVQSLQRQLEATRERIVETQRQLAATRSELDRLKRQTLPPDEEAKQARLRSDYEQQQRRVRELEGQVVQLRGDLATTQRSAEAGSLADDDFGNYYALVIGINNYRPPLASLQTSINDVERVAEVLAKRYRFKKIEKLTNATHEQIIDTLHQFKKDLRENDNLLIYYAGHGKLSYDQGHWLAADADSDSPANWISTYTITSMVDAEQMQAKHVLIVADSCYSGTLTRGELEITEQERAEWQKIRREKPSRTAITSGGVEPVLDTGSDGHSVFAKAFIDFLERNDAIVEAKGVYDRIAPIVSDKARKHGVKQAPEYGRLTAAGDENGEFFFVPVSRVALVNGYELVQ